MKPFGVCLLAGFMVFQVVRAQEINLRRTHVVRVFEQNRNAVVNVNTTQIVRQPLGIQDPFFDLFLRRNRERNVRRTSLGSGFIVHPDGYVVTNAHVVDRADEIDVILADEKHLTARVLASDRMHDLALLKIVVPEGMRLQAVQLGDSKDVMIGEPVVAIGNPLGYQHSVTSGIVSATKRSLAVEADWELSELIQTDTSINPGNSGGPLFNAYGQVIGINTVIRGDAQNIGFAIPVHQLRALIPELMSPSGLNRVDLGGRVEEVVKSEPPARVTSSLSWRPREGGDAASLDTINGQPVSNIIAAYAELLKIKSSDAWSFSAAGGARHSMRAKAIAPNNGQRLASAVLGLTLREIRPDDARAVGLGPGKGLLVTGVEMGGPSGRVGVRVGDVVVQLGRYRVGDLETLASLLSEVREGVQADLFVIRDGRLGRIRVVLRGPA